MAKKTRPNIILLSARVIGDDLAAFDHSAVLYVYLVDGITVRGVQWSGRFDGPAEELAQHLVQMIKRFNLDYITTTETQQDNVMHVIQEALADHHLRWSTKRAGEYALLYDMAIFTAMPKYPPTVQALTGTPGIADWRQMKLGKFNIHHKKIKRRFRILVAHGPSHIQEGDSFRRNSQVQTAHSGWPRLGRMMRRFDRFNKTVVQIATGDCNADLLRPLFFKWFEKKLGATSIWRVSTSGRGTHHGRRIDGAWIKRART